MNITHEEVFTTYSCLGLGCLSECPMFPGKCGIGLVMKYPFKCPVSRTGSEMRHI